MKKIKKSIAILAAFLSVIVYSFLLQKNTETVVTVSENENDNLKSQAFNQDCTQEESDESMLFVGCNGFF